jgi:phosphoserine phosphatase
MGFELVVFDCDGVIVDTLSSWQWIHDHYGVTNEESLRAYLNDEIDALEFMRRDIVLWKEKDPDVDLKRIQEILLKIPLMTGAEETFRQLKSRGSRIAIISGGLDLLVDEIKKKLGADISLANSVQADGRGRLTGEGVLRVEPKNKGDTLLELMKELGLTRDEVASVGDTHGDATMFPHCRVGIAFNPADDVVKREADVVIKRRDLSLILEHLL